jgi:hypothetical protein
VSRSRFAPAAAGGRRFIGAKNTKIPTTFLVVLHQALFDLGVYDAQRLTKADRCVFVRVFRAASPLRYQALSHWCGLLLAAPTSKSCFISSSDQPANFSVGWALFTKPLPKSLVASAFI